MIANLKPYSEYKRGNITWLDNVPAHWQISKLRTLIKQRNGRNRVDLPLLSVVREKGVIKRSITDKNHNVIPDDLSNYKIALQGDLVINKMKAWQGSLGIAPCDGIVSPAYYVYEFRIDNLEFGKLLLRSRPYVGAFGRVSDGVRVGQWDLSIDGMKQIPVLLPPPDEQETIVRFLNHATHKIDLAIRAKRKLVNLLNEQQQTIIHRAITRGLGADVPMRESGIDWIGEIPAHWKVLALKRVVKRLIDCEHKTAPAIDKSEYHVVRTTAIRNRQLHMHGTYCTSITAFREWTRRGSPQPGDILFTREAPAGEACIVPDDVNLCLGQRTVLIKPKLELIVPLFLVHMIYSGPPKISIKLASQGSTVGHFNMSDIGAMTILCPPLKEQLQLVNSIQSETKNLIIAIEQTEREIKLLQEYRTRLITDVVTGQLDVREVAKNLPMDDDELLNVDEELSEEQSELEEEILSEE